MINVSNFKPMTPDEMAEWLSGSKSFQDRERAFLTAEGYSGNDLATDWMKYLIAKGIAKTDLATMQKQWFVKHLLANAARANRGYAIVPQNVDMVIVR